MKIPLIISVGTMILLYLMGYFASIDFLVFKISRSGTAEIALLPIAIGLVIAFISDSVKNSGVVVKKGALN